LVGMLQPLVPLLDQIFKLELWNYKVMARTSRSLGKSRPLLHHPLEICIVKNIYKWEMVVGLGWDATASGSVIGSDLQTRTVEITK
jgi:hypothetical protein